MEDDTYPAETSQKPPSSPTKHPEEKENVSPETGKNSPETHCTICLDKPKNKCYADKCLHHFCYSCLLEWSKVKAECPLCKQPLKSIIFNVRADGDYDLYHVDTDVRSFYSRSNITIDHEEATLYTWFQSFISGTGAIPANSSDIPHDALSCDYRAAVYRQDLWVRPLADTTGQDWELYPEYYRSNPTEVNRVTPWLNRELSALLPNNTEKRGRLMELLLQLLPQYPVRSQDMFTRIRPFLGGHTSHFMRELYEFIRSEMDMMTFDQVAQYVRVSDHTIEIVSGSDSDTESSSDSDISTSSVGDNETTASTDSNSVVLSPERNTSQSTSVPSSLSTLLKEEHNYGKNLTSNNDRSFSPPASTSGAVNTMMPHEFQNGITEINSDGDSSSSNTITDLTGEANQGELQVADVNSDDCVIVAYKAIPEVITLDSDPEVAEEGEITIAD